jgi:threonyl-tRNA synthetase
LSTLEENGEVKRVSADIHRPFWLSPRQAIVLPITDKLNAYAEEVRQVLHDAGFYADSDLSDKKLQKKIRDSQLAQYNYILVVGEKEYESKTVNIRTR